MSAIAAALMAGGVAPRTPSGLIALAERLGCEPAVLGAIVTAESNGKGYDEKGRVKVLFEKHRFWRNLPVALRTKAEKAGLARKKFIRPQDGGYRDQPNNDAALGLLTRAMAIDETAALKSASYGLGQVLGENAELCGWPSVQAFVLDMTQSEDRHVDAMAGFLVGNGAQDEMQARDFHGIARIYNGAGNVTHYAAKMEAAYRVETGKAPTIDSRVRASGLRIGSKGFRVEALQKQLLALGYAVKVDGDFGTATRRAVLAFQGEHKLEVDGVVGPATQKALDAAQPVLPAERVNATVSDLRQEGSPIVKAADKTEGVGILVAAMSVLTGLANAGVFGDFKLTSESIGELREVLVPLADLLRFAASNGWMLAGLGGVALVVLAKRIKAYRLKDHQTGQAV